MKSKSLIGEICREAETASSGNSFLRLCSDACLFFLGESEKMPGKALCSNPNYIKFNEACLSAIGAACKYCTTDDSDQVDLRYISYDYKGKENRRSSRNLVYNTMLFGMKKENKIVEYPSVILDISLEGIGCIVPNAVVTVPKEFYLIKKLSIGNVIKLICIRNRVIKYSSVIEIGAMFKKRISQEAMDSLLKIG